MIPGLLRLAAPYGSTAGYKGSMILGILRRKGSWRAKVLQLARAVCSAPAYDVSYPPAGEPAGAALLFIEDYIPDPSLGSGYPRSFEMLKVLAGLGCAVTVVPMWNHAPDPAVVKQLLNAGVRVVCGPSQYREMPVRYILGRMRNHFSLAVICRPHNMKAFGGWVRACNPGIRLVYDAEAVFAARIILRRELLLGRSLKQGVKRRMLNAEVRQARKADAVIAVSKHELDLFRTGLKRPPLLCIAGHRVEPQPSGSGFGAREGVVFIGGILESPCPNEDAVLFFVREIWPLIRKKLETTLTIVGENRSEQVARCRSDEIAIVGRIPDLAEVYNRFRIMVAPTRYSGGIPLKVIEACARGLPCVITPLLARQLSWNDGCAAVVAQSPEAFARGCLRLYTDRSVWESVRCAALKRTGEEYSRTVFAAGITRAIGGQPS